MPGKQAKAITPPMLKRMLRRVSHSTFPARDRAMILLSVKAGLRACEIAGLDWSMVLDAQGHVSGTIHVRATSSRRSAGGGGFPCILTCRAPWSDWRVPRNRSGR
jgi:integrase